MSYSPSMNRETENLIGRIEGLTAFVRTLHGRIKMNKYVVVRGQTVIDEFESLDLAQKYVKDWPGNGLRIMERGLSGTLYSV